MSASGERGRSEDRRVDHVAEHLPEIEIMVGRVRHHDCEQGVARRDPERRAGEAAPGKFADRAGRRRDPGFDAHREAEPVAVAGREKGAASVDLGAEMVARHVGERARSEHARAVERAAAGDHGEKARVIADRRNEPGSGHFERRRRAAIDEVECPAARSASLEERLGEPVHQLAGGV